MTAGTNVDNEHRTPDLHPPIEGLNIVSGLQRVLGRVPLYHRMLRMFVAGQRNTPQQIRDALTYGDRRRAELLAHTLASVAGNVGASALEEDARRLELALRRRAADADLLSRLDTLTRALAAQIEAIIAVVPNDEIDVGRAREVTEQAASECCAELVRLLAKSDARAGRFWRECRWSLTTLLGHHHGQIGVAIDSFDYARALSLLTAVVPMK